MEQNHRKLFGGTFPVLSPFRPYVGFEWFRRTWSRHSRPCMSARERRVTQCMNEGNIYMYLWFDSWPSVASGSSGYIATTLAGPGRAVELHAGFPKSPTRQKQTEFVIFLTWFFTPWSMYDRASSFGTPEYYTDGYEHLHVPVVSPNWSAHDIINPFDALLRRIRQEVKVIFERGWSAKAPPSVKEHPGRNCAYNWRISA